MWKHHESAIKTRVQWRHSALRPVLPSYCSQQCIKKSHCGTENIFPIDFHCQREVCNTVDRALLTGNQVNYEPIIIFDPQRSHSCKKFLKLRKEIKQKKWDVVEILSPQADQVLTGGARRRKTTLHISGLYNQEVNLETTKLFGCMCQVINSHWTEQEPVRADQSQQAGLSGGES